MLRKVFLVGFISFFKRGSVSQLVLSMLFTMSFMVSVTIAKPFLLEFSDSLKIAVDTSVLITLQLSLARPSPFCTSITTCHPDRAATVPHFVPGLPHVVAHSHPRGRPLLLIPLPLRAVLLPPRPPSSSSPSHTRAAGPLLAARAARHCKIPVPGVCRGKRRFSNVPSIALRAQHVTDFFEVIATSSGLGEKRKMWGGGPRLADLRMHAMHSLRLQN